MAGGLAGDDDPVGAQQLQQRGIVLRLHQPPAVPAVGHLRPKGGIALAPGIVALDDDRRRHAAQQGMEQPGLLHQPRHGMAFRPDQAVVGPDDQGVAALPRQAAGVVQQLPLDPRRPLRRDLPGQQPQHTRARPEGAVGQHLLGDHGEGRRRAAVGADPERRVEDLQRRVGVEGRDDPVEDAEVTVDERGDPRRVLDRAAPGPAADIERALRQAEIALQVDQQQVRPPAIRRPDPAAPGLGGRAQAGGVRPVRPVAGAGRIEEGGSSVVALMPTLACAGTD